VLDLDQGDTLGTVTRTTLDGTLSLPTRGTSLYCVGPPQYKLPYAVAQWRNATVGVDVERARRNDHVEQGHRANGQRQHQCLCHQLHQPHPRPVLPLRSVRRSIRPEKEIHAHVTEFRLAAWRGRSVVMRGEGTILKRALTGL